jgi:pimeloyl-ACP methyl ester carboxylesterase
VDLETHIQDIMAVLECEELVEVVMVAHSYGGVPATGVVDRMTKRIERLVYLDASVGRDGHSAFDDVPRETVSMKLSLAVEVNGGKALAAAPAEWYGISDAADVAWVNRRVTPQPIGTYTSPLRLMNRPGNGLKCSFIRCIDPALPTLDPQQAYARELGMQMLEIRAGHDAMITAPLELAEMLLRLTES